MVIGTSSAKLEIGREIKRLKTPTATTLIIFFTGQLLDKIQAFGSIPDLNDPSHRV
jgi:hypothetical protein